jgi:hypothetical protein
MVWTVFMPVGASKTPDPYSDGGEGPGAYASALNARERYQDAAARARRLYAFSELALVIFAAAVPVAGVLSPGDARWAAILGGVVTVLTGLRAIFHWRDNWTRYSIAYTQVLVELRLYSAGAAPYNVPEKRDARLAMAINRIETTETTTWSKLKGPDDTQAT